MKLETEKIDKYYKKQCLERLLGDLSVWTWINNRNEFYSSLISKDTKLSEMTIALVGITHVMQQKSNGSGGIFIVVCFHTIEKIEV